MQREDSVEGSFFPTPLTKLGRGQDDVVVCEIAVAKLDELLVSAASVAFSSFLGLIEIFEEVGWRPCQQETYY